MTTGAAFLACRDCRSLDKVAAHLDITVDRIAQLAATHGVRVRECSHVAAARLEQREVMATAAAGPLGLAPPGLCVTAAGLRILNHKEGWCLGLGDPTDGDKVAAELRRQQHGREVDTKLREWVSSKAAAEAAAEPAAPATAEIGEKREDRLLTLLAAAAHRMAALDAEAAMRNRRPATLGKGKDKPNFAAIAQDLALACGRQPGFGEGQIANDLGRGAKLLTVELAKITGGEKSG